MTPLAQCAARLRAAPRTVRVLPTVTDHAAQPERVTVVGVPSPFRFCVYCGRKTTSWVCPTCEDKK